MMILENSLLYILINEVDKNIIPINTWKPWKPVKIKKIDPYTLSAIQNNEYEYSIYWVNINQNPKIKVVNIVSIAYFLKPAIKL